MDTFQWLLPILLIWPAIKLVQLTMLVRILRGLRFGGETVVHLSPEQAPAWFLEATQPLATELESLGFVPRGISVQHHPLGEAFDNFGLHLVLPDTPVGATLRMHGSVAREGAAYVNLHTTLSDGRELVTANHAEMEIAPLPPELDQEVMPAARLDELVARHQARLAAVQAAGATPRLLDDDSRLARSRALLASARERLRASGLAENGASPAPDAPLQLRWSAAFSAARRILRAIPAEAKVAKTAGSTATAHLSDAARTAIELRHYRQMLAMQDLRLAWLPKTLLMVGSLVLFAVTMLGWSITPALGLVLIAALAFHEGGHLLGMRLFGFKDTQLLFLPFLGGVAVARDRLVLAPWKHLVILFLGPLPGIVVGTILLLWRDSFPSPELAREAGVLVLVFNAFNLLPILPLDGGQIMDVALVSRFPRLRVAFLSLSALGLALVGFASSSALLIFLGVFMLFRLPVEWKQAAIVKNLRRELPPRSAEETILHRLLPELRRAFTPALGGAQRLQLIRPLEERIRRPRPSWGTIALAATGYLAPLALCLVLAVVVSVQRGERRVAEARARAEAAGLAEPVAPAYSVTPDEKNAALPLVELERLLQDHWDHAALSPEQRERALALFPEADTRPDFSLPADFFPKTDTNAFQGMRVAYSLLAHEAGERLRYRDTTAALDLVVRGFSVLRHLRRAPQYWSYDDDRNARDALWYVLEEALVQGAELSERRLPTLIEVTDEVALLAYAHAAFRESRIQATRWFGETDSGEEVPPFFQSLVYLSTRLSPEFYAAQAAHYDDSIALDAAFRELRAGAWPAAKSGSDDYADDDWSAVDWELDRLGDDVGAQRLIRAGLALRAHLAGGLPAPETAAAISSPWPLGPALHPRSGEPMQLERRGEFLVLSIPSAVNLRALSHENPGRTWRVLAVKQASNPNLR